MHPDLSVHLHSDKCNELIALLQKCHQEHPFGRFFGYCNSADHAMVKCLKEERLQRRRRNYEKSLQTKERLKQLFEEDRKKRQNTQS